MKKFFPNIETAIIFVFILCVILWGVTRCNRKREDLAMRAVTEGVSSMALPDTMGTGSPAARNTAPTPTATTPVGGAPPPPPTVNQNQGVANVPPPTVPNPTQATPTTATNPTVRPNINTTTPATTPTTKTPSVTPAPVEAGSTPLYVLIDGLNVRTKPDLKAKSLGKLKLNDQVYFMNEVTPEAQTIRLADKTEVTKPWFKIKTKRGTVGWVHGSGVDFYKRKPQID